MFPISDPPSPAPKRSRFMETVLAIFVVSVAVSLLAPRDSAAGRVAGTVTDWINVALVGVSAAFASLNAKRNHWRLPIWVHALAGVALALTTWGTLQSPGWATSPIHQLAQVAIGPTAVYVTFLMYSQLYWSARRG